MTPQEKAQYNEYVAKGNAFRRMGEEDEARFWFSLAATIRHRDRMWG